MFIKRDLERILKQDMGTFPAVSVTGPRQSGKTTLVKQLYPDYTYLSFETPATLMDYNDDPVGFLKRHAHHVIFDEAQHIPNLFSYLQEVVDSNQEPGRFILSGSQSFLLSEKITQSLAGRVGVLELLPLSLGELLSANLLPKTISEFLVKGTYPRVYAQDMSADRFYRSYIKTYLERDVRQTSTVHKLDSFQTFIRLCALNLGSVFNASGIANRADVSFDTVTSWLSILKASYLIFSLRPYHANLGKRLIKAPKLYFWDTGLACHLLGLSASSPDELTTHDLFGHLFENAVIAEIGKRFFNKGAEPALYYLRDSNGNELDLIVEAAGKTYVCEIKSSAHYYPSYFHTIDALAERMGVPVKCRAVIYGGDDSFETRHGRVISYKELNILFE